MPTSRSIVAAISMLAMLPLATTAGFAQDAAVTITKSDVAAYKSALRLRPMQEVYWVPVAAALRALSAEGSGVAIDAQTIDRLMPVLRPLLASLDDDQKRVAAALAQRIGLARFASLI
jgi:hypothetical protein